MRRWDLQIVTEQANERNAMRILLCGANGFVGRHIESALLNAGHTVIRGVRRANAPQDIAIDYCNDIEIETWIPRLNGIDAVVNAVGVLRDSRTQPMARLHDAVPRALFAAAAKIGIKRVVQISALGVGSGIDAPYMRTKQSADDFLQTLNIDWAILRPSLIYGADGAGTLLFMRLAQLPFLMMPEGGKQLVQPVHVDDLAEAVARLITSDEGQLRRIVECVGPEAVSIGGLISSFSTQRGKSQPTIVRIPDAILRLLTWIGDRVPAMPIGSDTLTMLSAGSTGCVDHFAELLGHPPRSFRQFIP